ncbi:MAG: ATP-binding protein [Janthinobacterium lividum]
MVSNSAKTVLTEDDLPAKLTQVQAELTELRSQLASLQATAYIPENNPNPLMRFSQDGQLTFANAAARVLHWGLALPAVEQLHQQLREAMHTPARQGHVELGDRSFHLTAVHQAPPANSTLLYLTETTARVAAERQLAEQKAFTEQILATTPSLIYVRDAHARTVFQNQAMRDLYTLISQLRRIPDDSYLTNNPEELACYAQADTQVLATGQQVVSEDPLTLPNGETRYYHTVKRLLLRPDGTRQVLGVSTDITAQKLTRQALNAREELYHDLMTYSKAIICTHNLDGLLLTANPATDALLGRPLPGLTLHELAVPRFRPDVTDYLERLTEEGSQRGILTIALPNGEPRHVLFDSHLVREAGRPLYAISYGQDITERMQAEQQLKQAKTAAEAAVQARENFLANMSHEIRTPLNGVLGMAAQLARTALDSRQQEFLNTIRHSGQHLLHVINDVLDIAKITSGKLELEARPFNLCDSMGEALRPLAAQATEKGLHFAGTPLRTTCAYPWVLGDEHRLNQILINLVANAVKFTPAGGRVIVIGEQLSENDTTLTVRFSVEDTGIGIAPDKQELIFEGFTQAYADTARRYGGTGLGLSISRALVQQLGGELTLRSEPGKGSTFAFTLTLPKAPLAELPAPTPDAYDTGALHGRRLLVVEDNEINRTVARMLLEGWGALVDEAEDGHAGVARVAHEALYDVVLMDIQLPGLSGLEATAAIRALPDAARAGTRIVALTANAFRSDCERYLAASMNACLPKPLDEEQLYRTLVSMLPHTLPYDLTRLRALSRGREEFVQKIIRSFLQNMPGSLAQLQAAAASANWAEVARIVHHFKPSLESLGVPEVAALVAELEAAAPQHYAQLPAAAAQLAAQVQQALDALPREVRG